MSRATTHTAHTNIGSKTKAWASAGKFCLNTSRNRAMGSKRAASGMSFLKLMPNRVVARRKATVAIETPAPAIASGRMFRQKSCQAT